VGTLRGDPVDGYGRRAVRSPADLPAAGVGVYEALCGGGGGRSGRSGGGGGASTPTARREHGARPPAVPSEDDEAEDDVASDAWEF
jgi:hypothetical protein